MRIVISEKAGFCQGVKRALDLAYQEATQSSEPVYTLGPLVHNDQVISYLEDLGIEHIESVEEVPPSSHIIIRSHGVGPKILEKMKARGLTVIDATCIKVRNVQNFAKSLWERGYSLIILGAPDHPEVKAIREYVNDEALVINSLDEIVDSLYDPVPEKIGLVCQTTLSHKFFEAAVKEIKKQIPHIEIHHTICGATHKRQNEAKKVAEDVDLMIVIGSSFSSNTSKLAELCTEFTTVIRIETQDEIKEDWFRPNMTVGVTAGASTPEWIIQQVIRELVRIGEGLDGEIEIINADKYIKPVDDTLP